MSELDQHSTDGHGEHPPWLAHHFDTPQQQYTSAKLGMWAFLLTEVLFFSGLFCAYAVYRRNYPEIFFDGHHFLNTTLGAVNTAVLLLSSFTMAWAVRCAQLGKRTGLMVCLAVTLLCAFGFLVIKYNEYKVKWEHRMVPGQAVIVSWFGVEIKGAEDSHSGEDGDGEAAGESEGEHGSGESEGEHDGESSAGHDEEHEEGHGYQYAYEGWVPGQDPPRGFHPHRDYMIEKLKHADEEAGVRAPPESLYKTELNERVDNLGSFFGIYFCLTGLHGIHVSVLV